MKHKEVYLDQRKCSLIIIRDIVELSRLEYARSLEKMIEIMIASTSHDMRTPLNTIINMNKLVVTKVTDPQIRKWLKTAQTSTNLLLHLVNDTLDFFQIKSGKFNKKESVCQLNEIIEDCFDLVTT